MPNDDDDETGEKQTTTEREDPAARENGELTADQKREVVEMGRRSWLKTAGIAAVSAVGAASAGSGFASAASYETVTIPAGEDRNVVLDGNTVHENVLYDVTAAGAGVTFRLYDNATLRNVGIKGKNQSESFTIRMGGGCENITIEHVYTQLYDPSLKGPGGIICTKNSTGTITIREVNVQGYGNNGLYASKSDADITVEDSYWVNNRTTNVRLGGNYSGNNRTHVARNNVVWMDERMAKPQDGGTVPLYPLGGDRWVGLSARHGEPEFYSNQVLGKWFPDENGYRYGSNWATVNADDRTIAVAYVEGGNISPSDRIVGDVTLNNVAKGATDAAPEGVPMTAEEAASGTSSAGGSGGDDSGSGSGGGSDSDGGGDDSDSDGGGTTYDNDLKVDGSNLSSQVEYEITVSGEVVKGDMANDNDSVDGSVASGQVYGGIDTYEFSGEVTDVVVGQELPISVDGSQIDLDQYTESAPTIDRYEVTEAGSKNPHANVTVEWDVSDADGDLDSVLVEVKDGNGNVVDSATSDVAGDVAYDVDYFEIRNADGQRFDVVTTVTDTAGNQDTTSKTVQE